MDEAELYGDLATAGGAAAPSAEGLMARIRELEAENDGLRRELAQVRARAGTLEARCGTLEDNISALYDTAKREMDRRESTLNGVKQELNELRCRTPAAP
uniref:Uncharacterized protein n=1 Tax=Phaeomonas parva TaxID=124430 RepID=A0A7S1UHC7_9STRA|mmetsp:Transcript_5871/g.16436  ORF Transcript_5871/g.16436 Transcript_5871/m.16436 type:complete len:100 (+) Transcript_5871:74-373(+)